jgi:hypothetical protein
MTSRQGLPMSRGYGLKSCKPSWMRAAWADNVITAIRSLTRKKGRSLDARRQAVPTISTSSMVRCREIAAPDCEGVINLLAKRGDRRFWERAIKRLEEHCPPPGLPKFGYLLESNNTPVGVLLLIFSARFANGEVNVRCNGSSLYIEPAFRGFATLLIRRAERHKGITYLNITPSRHIWPMVEAQGYRRFVNGTFVCIPLLCKWRSHAPTQVQEATPRACRDVRLYDFERELLLAHAKYGCVCLICELSGNLYPFVFALRRKFLVPLAHLVYCRDQMDFMLLARPLGKFLGRRRLALVILDSNGPIQGLIGRYFAIYPKYWKGTDAPRLGDLAYTEIPMFGI